MRPRKKSRKLIKSEVIGVRMDPKLRMAAEFAAGKERRTLASFIEWAIERAVKEVEVIRLENEKDANAPKLWTALEVAEAAWDINPAIRLANLAEKFPALLIYQEQQWWEIVKETPAFWNGEKLNRQLLKNCFPNIQDLASGEISQADYQSKIEKQRGEKT